MVGGPSEKGVGAGIVVPAVRPSGQPTQEAATATGGSKQSRVRGCFFSPRLEAQFR